MNTQRTSYRSQRDEQADSVLDNIATPKANECEEALLVGIIRSPESIDHITTLIEPNDFFDERYGNLYAQIRDMYFAGLPANDITLLGDVAKKHGLAPDQETFARIIASGVSGHEKYYAMRIKEAANLRRQQKLAIEILNATASGAHTSEQISELIRSQLNLQEQENVVQVVSLPSVESEIVERLRKSLCEGMRQTRLYTGFRTLDAQIGSFLLPGRFCLLAARTSVGKTALTMQMCKHLAERGHSVLVVSLEMTAQDLAVRNLAAASGITVDTIESAQTDEAEVQRLLLCSEQSQGLGIYLWSPARATTDRIEAVARVLKAKHGLELIVIDYVGLIAPRDRKKPRQEQIAEISGDLKHMAQALQVPVLALAQLNREADGRVPQLSNLRESGSLEQDADTVLLLHRESLESRESTITVAKNRQGTRGTYSLIFDGSTMRFVEDTNRVAAFDNF